MKSLLLRALLVLICVAGSVQVSAKNEKGLVGAIKVETPKRPKGQKDVLLLIAPKLDTVRVGFIGVGNRGISAVERWTKIPGAKITAICDLRPELVERAQNTVVKAGMPKAATYDTDENAWKQLCQRDDVDLVYIVTDWIPHAEMARFAMECGKHAVIEVPAAMSMDEIWMLIDTSEKTRKHCMMLENCIYDQFELTALNMAQKGLFGEILNVQGGYIHHLFDRNWPIGKRDWRITYNKLHRGDLYPTHGLGPICQLLNIHRGDRIKTLVSMDTKAVEGSLVWKAMGKADPENFKNGDHTMTFMRTEKGKSILIEHNVMTPRPYNRKYQLTGSRGYANKYPVEEFCFAKEVIANEPEFKGVKINEHDAIPEGIQKVLMEKYMHPIWKELQDVAKKVGGHGGMDYIMDYRLVYCLRNGLPLDMNVYDLAEWCCVVELSRLSIENGCAPVEVPDFTRGAWDKIEGYSHAMAE